jgi:hypothetical protein
MLLAACCAVATGCGASQPKAAAVSEPPPQATSGAGGPRAEIDALDRQIDADLARAQLPPPAESCTGPACAQAMSQPFAVPSVGDAQCRAPVPTTHCADVCSISTSICDNQRKICELAEQLPGDDWAAGKCARARVSCKSARDQCCSCTR